MTSRPLSDLPIETCTHCQREFIRYRRGETYCHRPECQKERERAECIRERLKSGQATCKRSHLKKATE